jgi:hypothetical protein
MQQDLLGESKNCFSVLNNGVQHLYFVQYLQPEPVAEPGFGDRSKGCFVVGKRVLKISVILDFLRCVKQRYRRSDLACEKARKKDKV